MGNYYSIDHIAEDHIHMDVICKSEESQQKYRLGTVINRLRGGGGGLKIVVKVKSCKGKVVKVKGKNSL